MAAEPFIQVVGINIPGRAGRWETRYRHAGHTGRKGMLLIGAGKRHQVYQVAGRIKFRCKPGAGPLAARLPANGTRDFDVTSPLLPAVQSCS